MFEYRIVKKVCEETYYTVERRFKLWFIKGKWRRCKLEVFYGYGSVLYPAVFETYEEAKKYVEHKGALVNGLIPGHPFYQD